MSKNEDDLGSDIESSAPYSKTCIRKRLLHVRIRAFDAARE